MSYEYSAGAVVYTLINGEVKYLIIKSTEGIYGFPKGHLEIGEDEITAAKREIFEETGIKADLLTDFNFVTNYPLPKKPGVTKRVTYFIASYSNQSPTPQECEVSSIELMSYTDAYALIPHSNIRELLTLANNFISNRLKEENSFALTFLGTCACDFSPRLQEDCKSRFDKNARRASSVLMNGSYLIDAGLHILDSLRIYGKSTEDISDIFVTHLHIDHFDASKIAEIAKSRSTPLRIWVNDNAIFPEIPNTTVVKMVPFVKYNVDDSLFVTGMPANHDAKVYPQHFIFERNGKKFFYGCDGGWFINSTFRFLKNQELDMAILDCTTGDYVGDFRMGEHNSIPMIRLMLPSLRTVNAINAHTALYLSHLAPSLHAPHDKTVEIANDFGANVAHDGLTITL